MWRTRLNRPVLRGAAFAFLSLALLLAMHVGSANASSRDRDGDGMPNRWEQRHGLDVDRANATGDVDHDRLSNLAEFKHGAKPKDEDSDNDGIDDGDEIKTFDHFDVDDADTNDNGVEDGDQDTDHDGEDNEDEDDADEACRADDDDRDHDGLDDEDENDFGMRAGDADSDDDGIEDGNEDSDDDDVNDEDSDDDESDECDDEREDRDDVIGSIVSFDAGTSVLTMEMVSGTVISAQVTEETELEFDSSGHGSSEDATTADLVSGHGITDFELDDTGALEELELARDTVEDED